MPRTRNAEHGTWQCGKKGCQLPECHRAFREHVNAQRRAVYVPAPPRAEPEHGTWQCRCDAPDCKKARAAHRSEVRTALARTRGTGPRTMQGHGTRACARRGCKQEECLEARRKYQRADRELRLSEGRVSPAKVKIKKVSLIKKPKRVVKPPKPKVRKAYTPSTSKMRSAKSADLLKAYAGKHTPEPIVSPLTPVNQCMMDLPSGRYCVKRLPCPDHPDEE